MNDDKIIDKLLKDNKSNEIECFKIKRKIHERIPSHFRNANLANTNKKIQEYYKQDKFEKKGFFLHGKVGTGKTYTMYALAIYLLVNGQNVCVFNLPSLLNLIRSSFRKEETYNERTEQTSSAFIHNTKDIDKLIDIEFLMIDDIGKEKPSEWVAETLYYLINTRYENDKITFFTSNFDLDELAEKIKDESIVSRIKEMCEVYELTGKDKRL